MSYVLISKEKQSEIIRLRKERKSFRYIAVEVGVNRQTASSIFYKYKQEEALIPYRHLNKERYGVIMECRIGLGKSIPWICEHFKINKWSVWRIMQMYQPHRRAKSITITLQSTINEKG